MWEAFKVEEHPAASVFLNWVCKPDEKICKINTVLDNLKEHIFK